MEHTEEETRSDFPKGDGSRISEEIWDRRTCNYQGEGIG